MCFYSGSVLSFVVNLILQVFPECSLRQNCTGMSRCLFIRYIHTNIVTFTVLLLSEDGMKFMNIFHE